MPGAASSSGVDAAEAPMRDVNYHDMIKQEGAVRSGSVKKESAEVDGDDMYRMGKDEQLK
ncbi:hypothetical protein LTS18_005837, partial [Coniosporium uncinatum]